MSGLNHDYQTWIDRLVDGELSDDEYRRLLHELESQPDGWRRCALAFLEAQAWGKELGDLRQEALAGPESKPEAGGPRWSWLYLGGTVLACAASFLIAFIVALNLVAPFDGDADGIAAPQVASHSQVGAEREIKSGEPDGVSDLRSQTPQPPVGRYQLVVDGDSGEVQTVEMPVFSADDPRAGLLLDEYGAVMPQRLIQDLERQGHEVSRERNWIRLPGGAGTPVYVPVDELQVTPVSSRSFQ